MPAAPSFRDPGGSVWNFGGRVLRVVHAPAVGDLRAFLESKTVERLPATRVLSAAEIRELPAWFASDGSVVLEHQRIPFATYPSEWPPEMLHAAARLTLDLAEESLGEGFGLKDATPYNILWRGAEPVFVDMLSFERRDPLESTWLALAQFQRTFLLPLLANRHFDWPLDRIFATRRDGLEPEEIYRTLGPLRRFASPFLMRVSVPVWLGRRAERSARTLYRPRPMSDAPKAQYVLRALFARLRRDLESVKPVPRRSSAWSGYAADGHRYAPEQSAAKEEFVLESLRAFAPRRVLDIGCNIGNFSAMAAREGAAVAAIDGDPVVAGAAWTRARAMGLNILPIAMNIARPTPAMGWRNEEVPGFLDRACGAFDCVMMLALVHHLLVTERVPLPEIARLAAGLTADTAIVEFVGPEDPMFQRLVRGRGHLHRDLTRAQFEECFDRHFEIVRSRTLPESHRIVYALRKKA
jgi:SAM-dependent methyltransferase